MSTHEPKQPPPGAAPEDPREPYEPPRVTYAVIEVEEALMAMCKTLTGAGPVGSTCGGPTPCPTTSS